MGDEALTTILTRFQDLGFLGNRPIPDVISHARVFVEALEGVTGTVIDLGSGGGVPGLIIALDRPDLQVTLLDRRTKRTDALEQAIRRLRWTDRVDVVAREVDEHLTKFALRYDAVVARGFGPPDQTLRTACRAARPGGRIVISEPPAADAGERWPPELLHDVGVARLHSSPQVASFQRPEQTSHTAEDLS